MRSWKIAAAGAAFVLVGGGLSVAGTLPAAAATCASGVPGDVNGDGHAEVAVSESGSSGHARGAVHVFYGRSSGLVADASGSARNDQIFDQTTRGVPGTSEDYDDWGHTTAFGDFNHDGCADLAIGAPGENGGEGSLTVLYGSRSGLTTAGAQRFSLGGLFGVQDNSGLGGALSVGDLDDDGVDDLAIGAPNLSGDAERGGGVAILYGDANRLDQGATAAELISWGADLPEGDADDDLFGTALAVGDFTGDGTADLAVGIPGASEIGIFERGPTGFTDAEPRLVDVGSLNLPDGANDEDRFGSVLAAGDVDGDGRSDLAVGLPDYGCADCDESYGSGAVVLIRGSATGLTAVDRQFWTQDSPGVAGEVQDRDAFGYALAMGRLDAGPTIDLAIGTPHDRIGGSAAGSVTVLLGSPGGLTTDGIGGSRYSQDNAGVAGVPEAGDFFGGALSASAVQQSSQASLVIGAPEETVHGVRGTGQILQLAVTGSGPTGIRSRTFRLDSPGVKGSPSRNAAFGGSLS